MRRSLVLALTTATAAVALEDWIRVWPKSGRQSRRLTSDLDCAPFDASHLVARPRRKRADCQFYDQPDKNDDGLLCIGDRFKIANEVSFCAEPYSPGSWYLAAKKGIDLGQGRRLGADPATFDYHPTTAWSVRPFSSSPASSSLSPPRNSRWRNIYTNIPVKPETSGSSSDDTLPAAAHSSPAMNFAGFSLVAARARGARPCSSVWRKRGDSRRSSRAPSPARPSSSPSQHL